MPERKKPNNVRTGLLLGLVALAFFVGIFINRIWFAQ
ncbi:cytochrome oxidase small assembly protein [Herbaspirillum sp. LeCh32-8]|nr:cytochrome oxidase small assembly protein [Herbaspirillum sp. LeCh32-8]MBP0600076.1 cytochrome oxidase small assembly protein [Herbaspirillum sp. LeCh32-8]